MLIVEENVCSTLHNKAEMVLLESLDQISKAIKDQQSHQWIDAWNEVQATFPTLILGRMHHHGA